MYLRFATRLIDEDSHKQKGVFVAAYELLDSGDLSRDEWQRVKEILNWFEKHVPAPPKHFNRSRAIFWFKSEAKEGLHQIWDLIAILRQHGHFVEVLKCRRLANVCYRDDLQVAAYPSDLDGRITVQ